jgi:hypothetical protein
MAPWANRLGIKKPNDEDEILSPMLLLIPLLAMSATAQGAIEPQQRSAAGVAIVTRHAGLASVVIGIAIIAQSSAVIELYGRAAWTGLAVRWCQATNPDLNRSGSELT